MIIQNDITEKKTCYFKELGSGDIFSYSYPPEEILMKLDTKETLKDEDGDIITAIFLNDGTKYTEAWTNDLVYPLTGKLIITG